MNNKIKKYVKPALPKKRKVEVLIHTRLQPETGFVRKNSIAFVVRMIFLGQASKPYP